MTPEELQRILRTEGDRLEIQRANGSSALYFVALLIIGIIVLIIYGVL